MTIPSQDGPGKADAAPVKAEPTEGGSPGGKPLAKLTRITPDEFYGDFQAIDNPEYAHALVTWDAQQQPKDHFWLKCTPEYAARKTQRANGRKPAYHSTFCYPLAKVSRWKGRTQRNAAWTKVVMFEVEGSAEKYAKQDGPEKGYADGKAAAEALRRFFKKSGLIPSFVVTTGSGGVHVYYLFDRAITPEQYVLRSSALLAKAIELGLKIDGNVMCDAARIMRAPGSVHQTTGNPVEVYRGRVEPYTLDEFDASAGCDGQVIAAAKSSVALAIARTFSVEQRSINSDVLGVASKYSYAQAATSCPAMRQAAMRNGQDTPYGVWILALRTAALSIEGREFAHDISCRHPDYDEAETDKKIDSLTGGPAGCAAWSQAYGPDGPCNSCAYLGQVKNPAVQLGAIVDVTPPGEDALAEPERAPDWVRELNQRFAVVRHGSKVVVVDFQTPSMTGNGVTYGFGFLDIAAFRAMFNGRFAPVEKPGQKPKPLSDAWLSHPQRRQYEGLVFAPGNETLPANILNLWRGFAVPAANGDVSLWLHLLAALAPDATERNYVLRWLAWKVQNPGGVPDTILIFKGAKGTGKNSLFDPLVTLFGRHAMLAADPELIAGRFTWHLMTLCFAVLDEAVFVGDPKQADRIKSRVTAKTMQYEQKGMDPISGLNQCAYAMLTNHVHAWQAQRDERRAVVIDVGEALRGDFDFWNRYHDWVNGPGPGALLHYLQSIDLIGFNPRQIPKGEALRQQIELTALRDPCVSWWHQCLTEGAVRVHSTVHPLHTDKETEIERAVLRQSYEQCAAARGRQVADFSLVAKRLCQWAGPDGIRTARPRTGTGRNRFDVLPPLQVLRDAFTEATKVLIVD